jgi:hypothetical protein
MFTHLGKCPHCRNVIRYLQGEPIGIHDREHPTWHGLAYHCPTCRAVLGVEMNPVRLRSDVAEEVVQRLRDKGPASKPRSESAEPTPE